MAFAILSTGPLAGSKLHTVRLQTVALAAAVILLAVLAAGVTLGVRIGQESPAASLTASGYSGTSLDPEQLRGRAVIDRIGEMSARLIRLESEAGRLAKQVGVAPPAAAPSPRPAAAPRPAVLRETEVSVMAVSTEPSGGPLVSATDYAAPDLFDLTDDDLAIRLSRLGGDLDKVDAMVALVAEVTTARQLGNMAYPSRLPVEGGRISSGFGIRRDPFTLRAARHTGLDFRAPYGAPILASAGGRVIFAGRRSAYGNTVEIDHGNGLRTRYGHASRILVRPGDIVLPGQRIALVGSTGRSTGPHVHFEVIRKGVYVEPRQYLARKGA